MAAVRRCALLQSGGTAGGAMHYNRRRTLWSHLMHFGKAFSTLFVVALLAVATGCSRENQDWRSAQSADTVEGYSDFVSKHPQSEFATQAKNRLTQLGEERDWERATVADTAEAYQQFLAQHPDGKWAQEARVRIENFNVIDGGAPTPGAPAVPGSAAAAASTPTPASAPTPAPRAVQPQAPPKAVAAAKPASKETSAAPKPSTASRTGAHHVQLGAFSSAANAESEWRRISGNFAELKGMATRVQPVQTARGKMYRLQVVVPSDERGRALCASLTAHKQACIVAHGN